MVLSEFDLPRWQKHVHENMGRAVFVNAPGFMLTSLQIGPLLKHNGEGVMTFFMPIILVSSLGSFIFFASNIYWAASIKIFGPWEILRRNVFNVGMIFLAALCLTLQPSFSELICFPSLAGTLTGWIALSWLFGYQQNQNWQL